MKTSSFALGFTLIEVMVSLAILGILATLAVPGFTETIKRYRVNAIKEDLISSIQWAHTEAIRRGTAVTLIRETGCGAESGDSDAWSCGWLALAGGIPSGRDANTVEKAAALQTTTVPPGYDVMHKTGRKTEFTRWGQTGVGQSFVIANRSDGNTGAATLTICIGSGGRIRTVKGAACS